MQVLQAILQTITALLSAWLMITLYQMVLTVFGFRKRTKDYADHDASASRFLVLVPAHNEEAVIGDMIDNLQRHEIIPRELYDFYVIADNCTDGTAEQACAVPWAQR